MKRLILLAILVSSFSISAQNNSELVKHYEAFHKQMQKQGDVQGVINALTHLNVLAPNQARQDTLSYVYMSEGKYLQALNTIGIDLNANDSNIAVEVKAVSLKSVNQPERAIILFEEMFKRNPSPAVAYELAELNLQTQNLAEATKHISFGIANATPDMKQAFYETNQPYQVPLKSAFLYLKSLVKFNENKTANIDAAVALLDEALALAPNFNLAFVSKNAILSQKTQDSETKN